MRGGLLLFAGFFLMVLASTGIALAQEAVPPPYAGMTNPFPWDDTTAQAAGKQLYNSCVGCHGPGGDGIKAFDFSKEEYAANMEKAPGYPFWILSEGRLDKGMPPYKSSFSEEQRWQMLTYIWTLSKGGGAPPGKPAPQEPSPISKPPPEAAGRIILIIPEEARAGQQISFAAAVRDKEDQPIAGVEVKFFIQTNFFIQGAIEIGETAADEQGVARLEYVPRQTGEIELMARYLNTEDHQVMRLLEASEPLYEVEVGIHLPAITREKIFGPESAQELGPMGQAPTKGLRIPGGTLLPFLMLPLAVAAIWFAYFRVMQIVSGIPIRSEIRGIDTRLIPLILLGIIATVGLLLLLMLITSPYTHFNLM